MNENHSHSVISPGSTLSKVAVIGTGGTIASKGRHSLALIEYIDHHELLDIDALVARTPELERVARIMPVDHAVVQSTAIGPPEWLGLARAIHDLVATDPDLAGIVVTHGTATLEETAYFLNLSLKVAIPVVVTGAQRPATGLASDGPMNLLNAVRVASSEAVRELGVLVVLNDEIHAAREVTKTSTLRLQTFRSPDYGALGHADADRIAVYRRPVRQHAPHTEFAVAELESLPRVDVDIAYAGADGTAIDAFVEAGAQGIVAAGFAPGLNTPGQLAALAAAREQGVVVVQSSRVGSGRVPSLRVAHVPGSVSADNLTPQKARVLLMLALTRSEDPTEIQVLFDRY